MQFVKSQPLQIAICLPSTGTVRVGFALSLASMINHTHAQQPSGLGALGILSQQTSILPHSRELLTEQALEGGFSHMLWIDSDMTFPHDALIRLMGHRMPCVGVNASNRCAPVHTTAESGPGVRLETTKDSAGLEKVHRMGFGLLLVETDAVRKIAIRPWFDFEWVDELSTHRGEDFYFCAKLREAGVTMYIDHDLSKEVGHIGSFTFYPTMAEPT